jgi:hypothetical protein
MPTSYRFAVLSAVVEIRYVSCVVVFANVRITPVKIALFAAVEKPIPVL